MAFTGFDLFTDLENVWKARAEFDQRRGPATYKPIGNRKPRLDPEPDLADLETEYRQS